MELWGVVWCDFMGCDLMWRHGVSWRVMGVMTCDVICIMLLTCIHNNMWCDYLQGSVRVAH